MKTRISDSLVIGLTGGIGSGKSAAMGAFHERGVPCIDADIVAREVVEPGQPALQEISTHFGAEAILPDGRLNRALLRDRIFSDPAQKQWLEQLLHPLINQKIRSWLAARQEPYCILASPLLLETAQHTLTDRILVIDVPEDLQISRTAERDQNSAEQVRAIIRTQSSRDFKRARADDIILNDKDLEHLDHEVERLHDEYMKLAKAAKGKP